VHATIGEIVAGRKRVRGTDAERIVANPIGMAIRDIALGHRVLARARRSGRPEVPLELSRERRAGKSGCAV
jgi:ornithine cyclodeaminase/alanine dehydrogenase-like protein (mu-crystallin family)